MLVSRIAPSWLPFRTSKNAPTGKVIVPMLTVKVVSKLTSPVSLAVIKADASFADWELVRISRLSVMPVSQVRWKQIEAMGKKVNDAEKPTQNTKKKTAE